MLDLNVAVTLHIMLHRVQCFNYYTANHKESNAYTQYRILSGRLARKHHSSQWNDITYDCVCAGRRVTLHTRYFLFIAPQCVISTFRPTSSIQVTCRYFCVNIYNNPKGTVAITPS